MSAIVREIHTQLIKGWVPDEVRNFYLRKNCNLAAQPYQEFIVGNIYELLVLN